MTSESAVCTSTTALSIERPRSNCSVIWLLPVPLFEMMRKRDVRLLDVPDDEIAGLGGNVLAVAPRRAVMLDNLPRTRARLEQAGCDVRTFSGTEIALKGNGGPTCLTRPLLRAD